MPNKCPVHGTPEMLTQWCVNNYHPSHWSFSTMTYLEIAIAAVAIGYFVCWAGIPQIISDAKNIWSWIRNKV